VRNPLKTLLAIIATLATVAAAVFAYLTWRDTTRPELTATAVVNAFETIPHFDSLPWRLNPGLDSTGNLKNTDPWGFFGVGAYLNLTITNNGSEDAENVRAHVPGAVYWCVAREGKQRECTATKDVFFLGVLAPREGATMQVWGSPLIVSNPSSIRVSHKKGIGRVELRTIDVSSVDPLARKLILTILAMLASIGILATAEFAKSMRERKQSAKKQVGWQDPDTGQWHAEGKPSDSKK
jgi:hypothetical protein